MWATPSPWTNRRLVVGWAVFAALNAALMYRLPGQETVPFHLIWISLAMVYGFTSWRPVWMIAALAAVILVTGTILVHHAAAGHIGWEETTEEPLMTAIFVVMVWHVYRRQLVLKELQRINELERRRTEGRQLFIRLASHELRTPITIARGYTELIRAAHQDASTVEDVAIVIDELDKLARITQRLVTLFQLEEPLDLRRVDIDRALCRIVRRWEPTAEREWIINSEVGQALISSERFEASLDCLLENAVKFTRVGQRIEVTGWRENAGWAVQVRDTGVGMSSDTAQNVLGSPPGQGTATGTGLGLAIVRSAVEARGGRVTIQSDIGEGTAVTMHVPQPAWDADPPITGPRDDLQPIQAFIGTAAEPGRGD